MTSKASKKTETPKEEVVEEEVVEEEPVVEDMPRQWVVKIWEYNLPLAVNKHIGSLRYLESTDELTVGIVHYPQYNSDLEVVINQVTNITLDDGTQLMLAPQIQKLYFMRNIHLAGMLNKSKLYAEEVQSFYETE